MCAAERAFAHHPSGGKSGESKFFSVFSGCSEGLVRSRCAFRATPPLRVGSCALSRCVIKPAAGSLAIEYRTEDMGEMRMLLVAFCQGLSGNVTGSCKYRKRTHGGLGKIDWPRGNSRRRGWMRHQ
jgi:hypothetical protein